MAHRILPPSRRVSTLLVPMLHALVVLMLLLLPMSCRRAGVAGDSSSLGATVFHRFIDIDPAGWYKRDTLRLGLPAVDTLTAVQAFLQVRLLPSYPYSNIAFYAAIDEDGSPCLQSNPTSQLPTSDSAWCPLSSSSQGEESHERGMLTLPLGTLTLCPDHTYTFRIVHRMRQDILSDLLSVGLRLDSTSSLP